MPVLAAVCQPRKITMLLPAGTGNNHVETGDLKTIPETAISVLTQVPRQQRSHLSARTGKLLYSFYDNNNGRPLATAIRSIQEIYRLLPDKRANFRSSLHRIRGSSFEMLH